MVSTYVCNTSWLDNFLKIISVASGVNFQIDSINLVHSVDVNKSFY